MGTFFFFFLKGMAEGKDDELSTKLLYAAGVVAGAGVLYAAYNYFSSAPQETPEEIFEKAFPDGSEQPLDKVKQFFRTRKGVNGVHLNFWLYVADQNNDGKISKSEFVRVLRVGSFSRFDQWAEDLRLMAFRVMDTDQDGVVDREELLAGLTKLFSLLDVHEHPLTASKALLPDPSDVLSAEEFQRAPLIKRIINIDTIQPLLI